MHNFPTHFYRTMQRHADKVALRRPTAEGVETETFKDWMHEVQILAIGLMEKGFETGERLALIAPNSESWLELAAATWMAGGCLVPLVPGGPRKETLRCLGRTGTTWIALQDVAAYDELRGQGNLPEHLRWVLLDESAAPEHENLFTLDALRAAGRHRLIRGGVKQLGERSYGVPRDQPTLILFDPEPGDDPHGAYFRGDALAKMLEALGGDLQLGEEGSLATILSLGWFQSSLMTMATLMAGHSVCTASSLRQLIAQLKKLEPTHLLCGPAFLQAQSTVWRERIEGAPEFLQRLAGEDTENFSMLRMLSTLSEKAAKNTLFEPIRKDLGGRVSHLYVVDGVLPEATISVLEQAGIALLGLWGLPEAGLTHLERPGAQRHNSVGRPIQGVACRIEGARREEAGEILLRTEAAFSGYWDEKGPRWIDEEGWIHTGLLGHLQSGYLFLGPKPSEEEE